MREMEEKLGSLMQQSGDATKDAQELSELQSQLQLYRRHAEEKEHQLVRTAAQLEETRAELQEMAERESTATDRALRLQKELLFHERAGACASWFLAVLFARCFS